MMTMMTIVNMIELMMMAKFRTSLSKVVKLVLGSFVIFAMRPETVLSPVDRTTPIPLPEMQ
jgi:hypothetical protein